MALTDPSMWRAEMKHKYEYERDMEDHLVRERSRRRELSLVEQIATRLFDGSFEARMPFDHITAYRAPDKVYVFVVNNGEGLMITDDRHLFPSDALVTQLRLLMSGKTQEELDSIRIGLADAARAV